MSRPDPPAGFGRAVPYLHAVLALVLTAALATGAQEPPRSTSLRFEPVPADRDFPEAAEAGALRWACADRDADLRLAFETSRRPFDAALVRKRGRGVCHIDYTPTLEGFRAHPDDLPARDLFINVDSLALVARRTTSFGDALDISARIVAELDRPVSVVLSTERLLSTQWYLQGASRQYGNRASLVTWRTGSTPNLLNPWTQDFLKSGVAHRRTEVLVPRNLFEGRAADGRLFAPFLDSFQREDGFLRSRLSWEGGDIQFVRHPLRPGALVMVHGQSARHYWGDALTDDEFAYVLRREFGADVSLDVSGIVPHADYLVAFLPADGIALVSEPVTGNQAVATAAVRLLEGHFRSAVPAAVRDLARAFDDSDTFSDRRSHVSRLVEAARREAENGWPMVALANLNERLQLYVHNHCRTDPAACFDDVGVDRMLRDDPELFRDWVTESRRVRSDELFTGRLLDIVESQVSEVERDILRRTAGIVRELETLGFRVVRVPRFGGDHQGHGDWAGVSYANSLLVDRVLFVPTFGLGDVETRMLTALQDVLPLGYRVVPTYARHMLLHNGGVHCTVATVRQPFDIDTAWLRATDED